jgi:hypothetical protein
VKALVLELVEGPTLADPVRPTRFCPAEIQQLHTALRQHDVARLQIAGEHKNVAARTGINDDPRQA